MPLLAMLSVGISACSKGAGDGAVERQSLDGRCAEGTEAGFFQLVSTYYSPTGSTTFMGEVRDRPAPRSDFRPTMTEGGCSLMTFEVPVCTPECTGGPICVAGGVCSTAAQGRSAGTVALNGLAVPYAVNPIVETLYESQRGDLPSPPAAPGAAIELRASGEDTAPFVLGGEAVEPLRPLTQPLVVTRDQPFSFNWVAPAEPGQARMVIDLDVGQNNEDRGSASLSHLACDLPDTGAATIPVSLVNALVDAGVGTDPVIYLSRRTEDSTQIAAGCVSFRVDSMLVTPVTVDAD